MVPPLEIFVIIVYVILTTFNVIGNSLLVYIITSCNRRQRRPRDIIILNLSVADLMVRIFFFSSRLLDHAFSHPVGHAGDMLCKFVTGGNFAWIGAAASCFCVVVLAFERYFAVIHPYSHHFSSKKVKLTIIACWLYAFLNTMILFFVLKYDPQNNSCVDNWSSLDAANAFSTMFLILDLIIPVIVMTYLYGRVIKRLWFKKTSTIHPITQNFAVKSRKSVTKMLLIVTIIYIVCWATLLIMYHLLASQWNNTDPVYSLPEALVLLNSSVNPIVFSFCSQRFRKQLVSMLRREKQSITRGILTGVRGDCDENNKVDDNTHKDPAMSYPLEGMEVNQ